MVALHAEAGRGRMRWGGAEPHELAAVVDDLRPVLAGPALDGEEDVAARYARGAPARGDDHSHAVGVEPRARVEAQHVGGGRARLAAAVTQQQPQRDAAAGEQQTAAAAPIHGPRARARNSRPGRLRSSVEVPVGGSLRESLAGAVNA